MLVRLSISLSSVRLLSRDDTNVKAKRVGLFAATATTVATANNDCLLLLALARFVLCLGLSRSGYYVVGRTLAFAVLACWRPWWTG